MSLESEQVNVLSRQLTDVTGDIAVRLLNWSASQSSGEYRPIADQLLPLYDLRKERFDDARTFRRHQFELPGNQLYSAQVQQMHELWREDRLDHQEFLRLLAIANPNLPVDDLWHEYDSMVEPVKTEADRICQEMSELLKSLPAEEPKTEK